MLKKVLVVEDYEDVAKMVTRLLQHCGYDARHAADGPTAITLVQEWQPEVILLDVGLPGIDGYEVARRIRQQPWGEKICLIAATGWGQDKDKALAEEAGFDYHLTKPINFQELGQLLSKKIT